jgi:hypothetical protein
MKSATVVGAGLPLRGPSAERRIGELSRGTGGSKMERIRGSLVRGLVLWTLFLLVVAVLLALQAVGSLYVAQQDCFLNYPSVPCPSGNDPALARLTFAFFGVPLVWLVGIGLAVLGRALLRRRSARPR